MAITSRSLVLLLVAVLFTTLLGAVNFAGAQPQATPVSTGDLQATISALQTQVAVQQAAEVSPTATANGDSQIAMLNSEQPEVWLTKDGKPMSDDQIAHDKPLWDAVTKARAELDETVAPTLCGPGEQATIRDIMASGSSAEEAWGVIDDHPEYIPGWTDRVMGRFEEAVSKALTEAIGQPPTPDIAVVPTVYQEVLHLDEQYPGCSTGHHQGDI